MFYQYPSVSCLRRVPAIFFETFFAMFWRWSQERNYSSEFTTPSWEDPLKIDTMIFSLSLFSTTPRSKHTRCCYWTVSLQVEFLSTISRRSKPVWRVYQRRTGRLSTYRLSPELYCKYKLRMMLTTLLGYMRCYNPRDWPSSGEYLQDNFTINLWSGSLVQ